ncbi:ATP-binding protein [Oceanobacillus sp. CAU 1775]
MTKSKQTDALIIPFNEKEELIIASDNSGSIGMKPLDDVSVPYEVVGYFLFRVAYMECIAVGGKPNAISLMNFNGNDAWSPLVSGIKEGIEEAGIKELLITGSTESNFNLKQSATAITVIGQRKCKQDEIQSINIDDYQIAIIGKPLVGQEVVDSREAIAPLHLFRWFSEQEQVLSIIPVGSKGIAYELSKVWPENQFNITSKLDLEKSSGPSTCFIVLYDQNFHEEIVKKAEQWLHI